MSAPKSEEQMKLEGHPNAARIRVNPKPSGVPRQPKYLGKYAKALWRRVVPDLIRTGVATAIDQPALVDMVQFYEDYRTEQAAYRALPVGSPEYSRAKRNCFASYDRYSKLSDKFGTNPLSRNAITIVPKTDDELDEFIQ